MVVWCCGGVGGDEGDRQSQRHTSGKVVGMRKI